MLKRLRIQKGGMLFDNVPDGQPINVEISAREEEQMQPTLQR